MSHDFPSDKEKFEIIADLARQNVLTEDQAKGGMEDERERQLNALEFVDNFIEKYSDDAADEIVDRQTEPMWVDFNIGCQLKLPPGTVELPERPNHFRLPDGNTVTIAPVVECTKPVEAGEDTWDLTNDEMNALELFLEITDRDSMIAGHGESHPNVQHHGRF